MTDHWYTRVLDPRTLVMTGLTRNGVWLIENGEITRPVRNLRFTQSYPQALGPGRGARRRLARGGAAVPLRSRLAAVPGAAPGQLELHRRRVRLIGRISADRRSAGLGPRASTLGPCGSTVLRSAQLARSGADRIMNTE